jgi:predicted dienelactone hydrolase
MFRLQNPAAAPATWKHSLFRLKSVFWRIGLGGVIMGGGLTAIAPPTHAADRIYFTYGVLERSVTVKALEDYVQYGKMDSDLAVYAYYAGPKGMEQVRNVLQARADLNKVAISQFLNSFQGEAVLKQVGQIIQPNVRSLPCTEISEPIRQRLMKCASTGNTSTPNNKLKQQADLRDSGAYIRAAITSALDDKSNGLTVLNFLRLYPGEGLRLNVQRGLTIVSILERLVKQTKQASAVIIDQAARERDQEGNAPSKRPANPRNPGPFLVRPPQTLVLIDRSRTDTSSLTTGGTAPSAASADNSGRHIPVDIYIPENLPAKLSRQIPVIVISHGLAADRTTFAYLAKHLASYGFAVLVPQHPGSDAKQLQALIRGSASEVSEPREFLDRPLDIKFLLDEMERRASEIPGLQGRLNLQNVGVLGQSFGGYTSLVLGGASINTQGLQQKCGNLEDNFNLSLLLQCRAGAIPPQQLSVGLRDPRVKAVIALNPITSAVFGQEGMSQVQVPTMILAGNADTVAPALSEQIQPFTWLTTPNKYLVMLDGGTHFSALDGKDRLGSVLTLPDEVLGPNPTIARRYVSALAVAFFKTYVANQPTYRSYLSASYADQLSETPLPLHLVHNLTSEQLAEDSAKPQRQSSKKPNPTGG